MSDNYPTLLWAHLADNGEDCICWVRFDLLQPLLRVVPRGPKFSPMPITTQSTTERSNPCAVEVSHQMLSNRILSELLVCF